MKIIIYFTIKKPSKSGKLNTFKHTMILPKLIIAKSLIYKRISFRISLSNRT